MDDKCIFNCEVCGNKVEVAADEKNPECCDQPMKKAEPGGFAFFISSGDCGYCSALI